MHILHVTPYYAPAWAYGGVVSAVSGLAEAQVALGHRVSVLTTDVLTATTRAGTLRETINGVEVTRCRNLLPALRRLNLSSPTGMRRALNGLQPDVNHVIHVIHCHELRTVENLIVTPAARALLILSPHGTLPRETGRSLVKQTWDRLFGQALARRFAGVIALTEAEADDVNVLWRASGLSVPPMRVIPNGVRVAPIVARSIEPEKELTVLFLGRLHERKGLQFLIPAFAKANVPGSRLLIVGPDEGMLTRAKALAAECGVTERVTFAGLLTGAAREAAFAQADVFALPATGEGLSMAALEAMAAGLPVILTPGCNLPEAEVRGAGLIVPSEVEPLAGAIRALLTDQERRVSMGRIGRTWMEQSYSWAGIASQVIDYYQETISNRVAPA